MTYNSPIFFLFVILVFIFFWLTSKKYRSWVLVIACIAWYLTWSPFWCIILFSYTASLYFVIKKYKIYTELIIFNIFVFLICKSINYVNTEISSPNGLSFYFFSILGFLIDQKRSNSLEFTTKLSDFMLFPSYFPTLLAGPVNRAKSFFEQLQFNKKLVPVDFIDALIIFFIGFLKLQLLVEPVSNLTSFLFSNYHVSHINFWLACFLSTLRAYIEFSSYCEMGRGVSRLFAINLNINFKPFYYAKSPNDFWARWNISIGEWLRDYISFPLMLKYGKKINQAAIILFSFLILGIWHEIGFNWVLFGIFNGIMVAGFYFLNLRLGQHKKFLALVGKTMAICIFLGNGLLAHNNFLELFNLSRKLDFEKIQISNLYSTAFCFLVFFIFEFGQEKTKNPDFYLKWPSFIKLIITVLMFLFFLYQTSLFVTKAPNLLPPLYFKF